MSGVLLHPLSADTSIYQWEAIRLVKSGLIPYIGTWENNFPGILLFHLLPAALFGNSELGFRITEVLFQSVVVGFLFSLLLEWMTPRASFFSCLLYASIFLSGGDLYYGQRDVFAAGLLTIAMWGLYRTSAKWRWLYAGILMGWIVLIRPLYILLPLSLLIGFWKESNTMDKVQHAIGVLLPSLLSVVFYLLYGGFADYYLATIIFLSKFYLHVEGSTWQFLILKLTHLCRIPILLAIIGYVSSRMSKSQMFDSSLRLTFSLFLLSSILIITLQHRYVEYHFAIFLTLLVPLGGLAIDYIFSVVSKLRGRQPIAVALVLLVVLLDAPIIPATKEALHIPNKFIRTSERMVHALDDRVIAYLSSPENKNGVCEICSYDPRLRLRLGRESATRFAEFQGLTLLDGDQRHPDFQEAWRQEYLRSIIQKHTLFIVVDHDFAFWNYPPAAEAITTDFRQLDSVLHTQYRIDTTMERYDIYRLKEEQD